MTRPSLIVSIVTYAPCLATLSKTLESLCLSIRTAQHSSALGKCYLSIVDNGPGDSWQPQLQKMATKLLAIVPEVSLQHHSGHGNIGYGCGHNLAAKKQPADYLLILNPDVILEKDALPKALAFMNTHKDVGLLSPNTKNNRGKRDFLCKSYPSVLALCVRGFAPSWVKKIFRTLLNNYELHDIYSEDTTVIDIPIVSGCFMFCRYSIWKKIGGFSKQYFMYFEDFDLSLRMGKTAKIAYEPTIRITHLGGEASRKGWKHIAMFVHSGITFFRENGWKVW